MEENKNIETLVEKLVEGNEENIKIYVCKKCGKNLNEKFKFCPECGTAIEIEEIKDYICKKCGITLKDDEKFCPNCGTPKKSNQYSTEITEQDIQENKNIAILCYLGIFLLIPYLTKTNSNFIKYHSNQGLLLLIFSTISSFILIIPILGWILGITGIIASLIFFIIGIINVIKGKVKPLPLIGKYKIIK